MHGSFSLMTRTATQAPSTNGSEAISKVGHIGRHAYPQRNRDRIILWQVVECGWLLIIVSGNVREKWGIWYLGGEDIKSLSALRT